MGAVPPAAPRRLDGFTTTAAIKAVASGTSGDYDAKIEATGGGSEAAHGEFGYTAALHHFYTYDATEQFRVGSVPGGAELFEARSGITGDGATLIATGAATNVNANIIAKGSGTLYLGNSSGSLLQVNDPGSPGPTANYSITAGNGASVPNPNLSAPASGDITFGSASGHVLRFIGYNGLNAQINPTGDATAVNYIELRGRVTGGSPIIGFTGSDANVGGFISMKGTGSLYIGNTEGNTAHFVSSTTSVSPIQFKPVTASTPATVTTDNSSSVAIGGGSLAATATAGFIMIPYCAGTPTGTPAITSGGVPVVFDTTDLKLYVYTGSAWKASGAFA